VARKVETIVTMTDDLDGSKADRTIAFSVDGTAYEIDLSKKNAAAFEKAFAPYIGAARKAPRASAGRARRSGGSSARSGREQLQAIREWARANGVEVSERGRIPRSVREAFDAAH
jgi:hypothetical protein